MTIEIDLRQAVYALSDALDLVGVDDVQHGKRVGFIAVECARHLGWSNADIGTILHAGLLHDCGVSSTQVHRYLAEELDWEGSQEHCTAGADLLQPFTPLADLAPIVRYHHTHWQELGATALAPHVARMANLIYMADRTDALAGFQYHGDLMRMREEIGKEFTPLSGTMFAPELVHALLEIARSEAFWYSLESRHVLMFLRRMEHARQPVAIGMADLRQFAAIFARIVDAKSRYTLEHSQGVARLARRLGQWSGLPPERCDEIEIAGLLHDLGKLRIPDEILEKPGPLTDAERSIINRHSFETYQILSGINGLEEVALWAAYHHETLDGAGYPFHMHGSELPPEARIIAVADIFQALSQQRPYREPVAADEIRGYLDTLAEERHLDRGIVGLVAAHLDECRQLAVGA